MRRHQQHKHQRRTCSTTTDGLAIAFDLVWIATVLTVIIASWITGGGS
jgi:hypothetical protein